MVVLGKTRFKSSVTIYYCCFEQHNSHIESALVASSLVFVA